MTILIEFNDGKIIEYENVIEQEIVDGVFICNELDKYVHIIPLTNVLKIDVLEEENDEKLNTENQ